MNKEMRTILPKLRLRQFLDAPEWAIDRFGNLAIPVDERAGTAKYTLMSVTSGVGLIPQIEKFGREIAGSAYKNYIVIRRNDFAYNKSATKLFPEGYISMLTEYDEAALPNSIFICFRIVDKECEPRFFDHLFHSNYHGAWLRKYIEVGSRAHGSLSVKTQHLWDMPVALPKFEEQQKIADCLSSLDELINAEEKKLMLHKAHKKGLMQKLFPAEGKTVPEIRFEGYACAWVQRKLGEVLIERKLRQKITDDFPLLAFAAGQGVINRSERKTNNRDFLTNDATAKMYLQTRKNDIVYNPSNLKYGAIDRNKYGSGVISPIYVTFETSEESSFIEQIVTSENFKEKALQYEEGTVIKRQSVKPEMLLSLDITITTTKEEQIKIGKFFCNLDKLIATQTGKIEALKTHKKGLLQVLFPYLRRWGNES